jgi:NADPH:quinone reductase-like Zn-dependent oxidoreductase
MMKAVRFHETGGPEVLRIENVDVPDPQFGEVRIKVSAIGLNRAETVYRAGGYLDAPLMPGGLGYEACGIIDAIGPGVIGLKEGMCVSTFSAHSMREYWSYGEYAVFPERSVRALPNGMDFLEGASVWNSWLTSALGVMSIGGLQAGQSVLIPAAASSTGLAALQMARAAGAISIATCRTPDKAERLSEIGADHVIISGERDVAEAALEITNGKGVDLIYDPVGGEFTSQIINALAYGGMIIVYGVITDVAFQTPAIPLMAKSATLRGFTLFDMTGHPGIGIPGNQLELQRAVAFLTDGFERGLFKAIYDPQVYGLDQMAEAHTFMEAGRQFGKVVVSVD